MSRYDFSWSRLNRMPIYTYLFLTIQIAVYVLMEMIGWKNGLLNGSENIEMLLNFGAMTPTLIIYEHQYWRFITPIFIHIGFFHLALNSLSLYFVGRILEPIVGHTRFFLIYILSGIVGNILSFGFSSIYTISAGASTSLFGIFAAFIVLGKMYRYHPAIQHMSRNMTMLIIMNLVMNIFDTGVDMLGHVGGAIGGVLLMIMLGVPKGSVLGNKQTALNKRLLATLGLIFVICGCLYIGFLTKG